MPYDCSVSFRREEEIAEVACKVRRLLRTNFLDCIDLVRAIECFEGKQFGDKGSLGFEIFEDTRVHGRAYVTFNPLTLHLAQEVWQSAKIEGAASRYIIAHEIGHVVLHDETAKKFSENLRTYNTFGAEEQSAEWQANIFADYLLAPNEMVIACVSVAEMAYRARMPEQRAFERFSSIHRRKLRQRAIGKYCGDSCLKCGNFTLIDQGLIVHCDICGDEFYR